MSKDNSIKLEDFQTWLSELENTYAMSTRENKRLVITYKGGMKVMVGGEVKWQGTEPYSAIEAYNAISEKWVNPNKDFKL